MAKQVKKATIDGFMELFNGRTDAWGSVTGGSNKEPVTRESYKHHLEGYISLGVYMMLDDNTVNFFAIDYDIKDIQTVLKIRQAFRDRGLPIYMAISKSKGYHLYGFCKEPVPATEVRQVCNGILKELNIECEVFPKQDKLDEMRPLGNYINLPCFGDTRYWMKGDLSPIQLEDALKLIQRIPRSKFQDVLATLPPPAPIRPGKTTTRKKIKTTKNKKDEPPCIESILKGVEAGARDVAAFALARHLLDQGSLNDAETLTALIAWDGNNKPPLNDNNLLKTKVDSATKGYAFGCSSVTGEPLLNKYCVGEENCAWLKSQTADKIKKGLIREKSFFETETHLYEEILLEGKPKFAAYEKDTDKIEYIDSIDLDGNIKIIPCSGDEITEGAITLPTGVEEYENSSALVEEVRTLIYDLVDMPNVNLEFSTWYVMMSWVYDKLNQLSYLRFRGDSGTGKSRALNVVGRLCYKPLMMAGAATPAPIYRLIRRWRGTNILEEADFGDTSEKSEVITILNCGFEKDRPVIRCKKDDPDTIQILPVFGPKVLATRGGFQDVALETRCMTFIMEETSRTDIPMDIYSQFRSRMSNLRNKLLLWRFRTYDTIDADEAQNIDLGDEIEHRTKQVALPFAIPFKDQEDVMAKFREFLKKHQDEIIAARREEQLEGAIVAAFFKLALVHGRRKVYPTLIAEQMSEDAKIEVRSTTIGKKLKSLNVQTSLRRIPGERKRFLEWNRELMNSLLKRYIPDNEKDDYMELFEQEDEEDYGEQTTIDMDI